MLNITEENFHEYLNFQWFYGFNHSSKNILGKYIQCSFEQCKENNDIWNKYQFRRLFELKHCIINNCTTGNLDLENLKCLEYSINLEQLIVEDIKLNSLKGINNCIKLKTLQLKNVKLNSLEGIEKLTNLEELDISNNPLSSLKGIENLFNLKTLIINETQISSLKELKSIFNLKTFSSKNCPNIKSKDLEIIRLIKEC